MAETGGFDPETISYVTSFEEITARHHQPMLRATGKVLPALDRHCRAMIERSTFCVISSFGPGGADVSPRGDPPGFCRILDDRHLLLPDRIGNNRFDTMGNLFHNPAARHAVPGAGHVGDPADQRHRAHHRRCGAAGSLRGAGARCPRSAS